MHGLMNARRRSRATAERGAVAVIVSLILTALVVVAALVLDFGLVRVDRQINKSAADAATMAGLQGLNVNNEVYPFRGVCSAIDYLQHNANRFSTVSASSGVWSDGNGVSKANGCTSSVLQDQKCVPGNRSTWAKFVWDGSFQGEPLRVTIQSGYRLDGSGWREETLSAVAADNDDGTQGCSQLSVVVTQARDPGFGSLATSGDVVSSIRSVGRVQQSPGGYAPAMLLLKRTGCPVLGTGGSGGGSYIHVLGAVSSDGKSQPGSIHADSDGSACSGGSNQNIMWGRSGGGIAAFAAPTVGNTAVPDPSQPGEISLYALENGHGANSGVVRDSIANVYGSSSLTAPAPAANQLPPRGRERMTRKPVDDRYLAGVTQAVSQAQSQVFGVVNAGNADGLGYEVVSNCNRTLPVTATKIFIDCTDNNGYKGTALLTADEVVFNGRVNPSAVTSLPTAKKVYIFGLSGRPALELGGASPVFSMHTDGLVTVPGGGCAAGFSSDRAILVIRDGEIKQSSGVLQLCNTTAIMMGGQSNACLPTVGYAVAAAPDTTPCGPSASQVTGSGQIIQTGGIVDWTAPNEHDSMTDANGDPVPAKALSWSNPNGPEDLAFWSESGVSSSVTYNLNGGGSLRTVGVFMAPNADPFIIGGGACQLLYNAQYIATSIMLNGNNTCISMRVDPNAAVTLPKLSVVGLVR